MPLYDNFTQVMESKPAYVQRAEKQRQEKILQKISSSLNEEKKAIRLLEVGIGTGMFASIVSEHGWNYTGLDRNEAMVQAVGRHHKTIHAEVPPFPDEVRQGQYDVAYSSFVVEHLRDGTEAFLFVSELSACLASGGVLALIVPDCLSLKMEFWNLDYTHRFPTTERNMTQILEEAGLVVDRFARYRGPFLTGLPYWLVRFLAIFYNYRLCNFLFGKRLFFYSVFQYINQDILFFICKKR